MAELSLLSDVAASSSRLLSRATATSALLPALSVCLRRWSGAGASVAATLDPRAWRGFTPSSSSSTSGRGSWHVHSSGRRSCAVPGARYSQSVGFRSKARAVQQACRFGGPLPASGFMQTKVLFGHRPSTSRPKANKWSVVGLHLHPPPILVPDVVSTSFSSRRGISSLHGSFPFSQDRQGVGPRAPSNPFAGSRRWLTHYERLGLQPPSNAKDIKTAYFQKAKDCHPDLHGESKTKEFQELSAAYSVLSDPRKKTAYDASGYQDRNYDAPQAPGGGPAGYDDFPSADQAAEMFRQVFQEFGVQEYYNELMRDLNTTYDKALATQDYKPFLDLARRRKGLVFGLLVPSVLILRFPWLVIGATRVVGGIAMGLFQVLARNPRLQAAVAAWVWKWIVNLSYRANERMGQAYEEARKKNEGGGGPPPPGGEGGGSTTTSGGGGSSSSATGGSPGGTESGSSSSSRSGTGAGARRRK